jgi:hypothetical protein
VLEHAVRLFVVLNKADYLRPEDLERTVAFTERVVRQAVPGWPGPVYALSSRPGTGDPGAFRRFRRDLERFLREERAATVADSVHRSATRALGGLRLALDLERRAASLPAEELAERRARFAATVDRLAGEAVDDVALLEAAVRRGLAALDELVDADRAELVRRADLATVERAAAAAVAAYRQAAGGVAARAAARVERLQAEAAATFGVPLPAFVAPDLDLGIARVGFAYPRLTLLADQLASASWRLLGARAARARALARAREQAADEAGMVLGRLRGAASLQLGEAARRLGARLQRHQAALAAGLTAAVDRGAGLLAEAERHRERRATELATVAELLARAEAATGATG